MADCCTCNTEISRDGSGQLSRYLKALDPSYALVDDRSIEELLVFTKRYANQIRFYDIPDNNTPGEKDKTKISWREFFRRDMAVIAASISETDTEQIKKDYDELRVKLDAHPTQGIFSDLFDPILGMAVKIDGWFALAIPENPLYADLQLAINSNLKSQIQKIVAYGEGFKYVDSTHPLNLDYSAITNKDLWGLNDTINADISIYQGSNNEEKILNAALYVNDIFNSFYGFLSQLIINSESYMQFALEQYPAHQPHMALFIAFLQLFRLAQDQVNGITQRMLDFYYRDVLHLTAKPSVPDKVHIVFELAKDVAEYDVAPGTALKAGKDASGKDLVYVTETDLVVNQAKVKEIKNIFIQTQPVQTTGADGKPLTEQFIQNIYARPIAKSQDGLGEKFADPTNTKWQTFGKGNAIITSNNICDQIALTDAAERKDHAQIGFAIASPQLVLQGGNRLIALQINDLNKLLIAGKTDFEILLTGKDGWLKINNNWFSKTDDTNFEEFKKFIDETTSTGIFNLPPDLAALDSGYLLGNNKLYIYLPIAAPAIIPFNTKLHPGSFYNTPYPVMQVLIGPDINIDSKNPTTINGLSLSVKVGSINSKDSKTFSPIPDGLKTLTLQNELGAIAAGKPFDPFTAFPFTGNSFYIGSDEVFNKPLGELAINIQHVMAGIDDALDTASSESRFELYKVYLREKKQWNHLSTANGTEFTEGDLTTNILFTSETSEDGTIATSTHPVERYPISYSSAFNEDTYKGFIEIENNFSISRKQGEFINSASLTSNDFQVISRLAPILKIKEISLSYQSTLQPFNPEIDQFFHVYPFGVIETYLTSPLSIPISAETSFSTLDKSKDLLLVNANNALLPQFNYLNPYAKYYPDSKPSADITSSTTSNTLSNAKSFAGDIQNLRSNTKSINAVRLMLNAKDNAENNSNQYTGDIQEGTIYIGLEKLQPLQSISMLFQFAEGSAEDEDDDPPTINWSYLSYNEWKPLKAESIVSDGTYGFQTTGIIKIDIPEDASTHNTIITDGLLWLSAGVTENSNRIPQLIDIVTQAAETQFKDQDNDPSHFDIALAAGSISKLSAPVAQISKVQQPFASFDGKHQEVGKEFYTRVSERLRHKGRAINAWDYEHIVLDRFPSIYKIKCITHTDPNCLCRNPGDTDECCGPQIAPGHVLLIPIANLKNRNAANPLQPKTSRKTLIAIQEYLKTLTSPFVHVYAKNPVYEQIIVQFKVQFYSGTDKGYYIKKLNDEIVHYLTPWAFNEDAEVIFNQKIYASSIVNFIEERPYVDFITDFVMGVCCNECCTPAITTGNTSLTVNVYDNENNKIFIGDVQLKIKELNITTKTISKVATTINNIPAGTFTLTVYFSLFDIITQKFTVDAAGNVTFDMRDANTPGSFDFYMAAGNEQTDIANFFSKTCGCSEIEWFLKDDPGFEGDIVAKPCTPRSILVSVPQHIIIPYIPPTETSCDSNTSSNAVTTNTGDTATRIKSAVATTPLLVKTIAKNPASIITKKAGEVAPVKAATPVSSKKIKAATKASSKPKKPK